MTHGADTSSRPSTSAGESSARGSAGWLHPQNYSGTASYRPPARWYRRLNPIGVPLTSLGLAPKGAVTLEVRGRRTGRRHRIPILVTRHDGEDYVVALAGESDWVRNVRAAGGEAVLRRRRTRRVHLDEVPVDQRAPMLAAYLEAGRRRSGEAAAQEQARWYFGLTEPPTADSFAEIAPRYPVFRVVDTPASPGFAGAVTEIAPGVVCVGPFGRTQTNVYLVRGEAGWVLVDAGWAGDADRIEAATMSVLGDGRRPTEILLTHVHPDHSGAARDLAGRWSCPVYLHPDEVPIASGDFDAMRRVAGPLDRWIILPVMTAMGRRRRQAVLDRNALGTVALTVRPGQGMPGLLGWEVVATPGHTPGHISLFRVEDGVLLAGDALVNLRVNSLVGVVRGRAGLSGPPWYTTWNPAAARVSMKSLAALNPRVLGSGHGRPLTGEAVADLIRDFAADGLQAEGGHGDLDGRATRITGEVVIRAGITDVFDTVADERNEPSYNPRIVRAEKTTDGPIGVGTRFVAEPKGMGAGGQMTVEVLEYEPPHRLHSVIRSSYMEVDGTLELEEAEGGTRLRWDWRIRLLGPLRVLTPVFTLVAPRWERRNWVDLKAYLEARRE